MHVPCGESQRVNCFVYYKMRRKYVVVCVFRGKYLFAVREISLAQSEQLTNEYILYMGLSDYLNMCLYIPFCRLEVRTMASDDSMEVSTHKAL